MEIKNRIKKVITSAFVAMGALAFVVQAETTTINGTAGGDDSWNTSSNWDGGVPSGEIDAVISDGILAQVNNVATPAYSGSLTLNEGSMLKMLKDAANANAVQGASSITMNAGSEIQVNVNANISFPPITLAGNASFQSLFGASDHQTDSFDAITGAYTLTITGFNNHTYSLNAPNMFSELVCNAIDRWTLRAGSAGSLGTGDVTVSPRLNDGRSAVIIIDAADAMADTATLTLNGNGWNNSNGGAHAGTSHRIVMNADDTIASLIVNGVEMEPGIYDSTESWLSGNGTLTVVSIDPQEGLFKRGDGNSDGSVNIADAVSVLSYLFANADDPGCMDSADANDDGSINIADAVAVLSYLFGDSGDLPPPFESCGIDTTSDDLDCRNYTNCEK